MEQWFRNEGADGFNIIPPYLPDALDDFVELVVPELQRRGLYRTAYEGKTFRENLGLPHPRGNPLVAGIGLAGPGLGRVDIARGLAVAAGDCAHVLEADRQRRTAASSGGLAGACRVGPPDWYRGWRLAGADGRA
ncbi:hypothetical protein G6F68_012406 [Rhizopus microsporus]|nr:hypothetical protein G6F68_012406 [Rhizopus microsporus]